MDSPNHDEDLEMYSSNHEGEIAVFLAMHVVLVNVHAFYNMMTAVVAYTIENGFSRNDDKRLYTMFDKIPRQVEEIDRLIRESDTS